MSVLLAALTLVEIGSSWDIQFVEPFVLDRPVTMIVLDPDNHGAEEVSAMKSKGTLVLCYVSVGTVEDWRADLADFPPEVIGAALPDWEGERYLDIRRQDILLPIMAKRFEACLEAGYDGIDPDNIDVFSNESDFDLSATDAVAYLAALADLAHEMDLIIGQKNAPELSGALADTLDFVVTESCWQYKFCDAFKDYTAAGKPIYAIEYTDAQPDFAAACAEARAQGISMILKDRELSGAVYESCN
jgi:uncharacterized protein (TIGR01370 family)